MVRSMPVGRREPGARRVWPAALGLLMPAAALVLLVLRALHYDFISDDAFITFRYARNLAQGLGPVFNPGERVEGFSSPLHMLLIALLNVLGADPLAAGRAGGLAAALALVVLAYRLFQRLAPAPDRFFAGMAALSLAVNPYLAIWSLGGLETTLYAALVLGALYPMTGPVLHGRAFLGASAIATALALTRPEGAVLYPLLVAWFLLGSPLPPRQRLRAAAAGVALFASALGALLLLRLVYYGEWLPNTYYVKSAFTSSHIARGWRYLTAFGKNLHVLPALAMVLAGLVAARSRRGLALVAAVTATLTAVVLLEGGDGLPAYRFLVPVLGPFALLLALAAQALHLRLKAALARAWFVVPGVLLALLPVAATPRADAQFDLYVYHKDVEVPSWTLVGRWLGRNFPPETTVAATPIGAVAYFSGLRVIDLMGLTDKHIARVRVQGIGSRWAGHEKHDGAYVLRRRPELLLLGNISVTDVPFPDPGLRVAYSSPAVFRREADIFTSPEFRQGYRYAFLPVAKGRYLNCFVRADVLGTRRPEPLPD